MNSTTRIGLASEPRLTKTDRQGLPAGRSRSSVGRGYDVGVKTSITTLFDGSVTCSVFPEIEQLEPVRAWMFTFSVWA
jgi:hypothetical protein